MMTATATRLPAHSPPPTIWLNATEYDAWFAGLASSDVGRMPKIAAIDSR